MNTSKNKITNTDVSKVKTVTRMRNFYFGLILLYIFHLNNFMMAADADVIESNEEEKIEQLKNKILSYKNNLLNARMNMQEYELVSFVEELCKKAMSVQNLKALRSIYDIIVNWSNVFWPYNPPTLHTIMRLDMANFIYLNDELIKTKFDFSQIESKQRLVMILSSFLDMRNEVDLHICQIVSKIHIEKDKLLRSYEELYKLCFQI